METKFNIIQDYENLLAGKVTTDQLVTDYNQKHLDLVNKYGETSDELNSFSKNYNKIIDKIYEVCNGDRT